MLNLGDCMKVRALVSFAGVFSMYKGEEKECNDKVILQDLLSCGYVEEVKATKKKVKANED